MKVTIEIDLHDKSDEQKVLRMLKAEDMALVLFEIIYNIKKHSETADEVYYKIYEELNNHNINIDELIN